jgi:hypothetical protein
MSKGVYTVEKMVGDKSVSINLTIHDKGFYTKQGWTTSQDNYLWKDVSELSVEGPDALQKRITATRILATGIFALAFKKKTGETFIFISFSNGREPLILKFLKKSEPEVKAIFAPFKNQISQQAISEISTVEKTEDVTEQISKLGGLFEKGLITEQEFKASKAKILGI